jgi:uncharacterized phage-associated protein
MVPGLVMDDLVYSAVAVANEFLRRARESYRALSGTQLHELIYCAQGWHLVATGTPLISGPVAAHRGGVYIPDLKGEASWGSQTVVGLLHEASDATNFPRVEDSSPARYSIDHVWADYGPLSRYDLTRLTITPDGPWDQVWRVDETGDSVLIPNRLLREWFGKVVTWRTAADHVSSAVDRVVESTASGPVVLDHAIDARVATNDPIKTDAARVRELRFAVKHAS